MTLSSSRPPRTLADIPRADVEALVTRYEGVLIDAFGVLLSTEAALPGAAEFIERLNDADVPYAIVTNDASKLASTSAQRYRDKGLPIEADRVITSGSLIARWFREQGLGHTGLRCLVLGPDDSRTYVERAGGHLIEPDEAEGTLECLVVADDWGYPLLETIDAAISMTFRTVERGQTPHLLLPNPDLIYPKGDDRFGITAGSVAGVIERALQLRYPDQGLSFTRLGKPHAPIFEAAFELLGTRDVVLFGDQLQTDIRGAHDIGIDSVLVGSGVTPADESLVLPSFSPTFWVPALDPRSRRR